MFHIVSFFLISPAELFSALICARYASSAPAGTVTVEIVVWETPVNAPDATVGGVIPFITTRVPALFPWRTVPNLIFSIVWIVAGNVSFVRLFVFSKLLAFSVFTDSSVMLVILVQLKNALEPMVSAFGSETLSSHPNPLNAFMPTFTTSGMLIVSTESETIPPVRISVTPPSSTDLSAPLLLPDAFGAKFSTAVFFPSTVVALPVFPISFSPLPSCI